MPRKGSAKIRIFSDMTKGNNIKKEPATSLLRMQLALFSIVSIPQDLLSRRSSKKGPTNRMKAISNR